LFSCALALSFCPIASLVGHLFLYHGILRANLAKMRWAELSVLFAYLSAGCATQAPPPKINLAGFPAAFRDGYGDGCQSAKPGAFKRRDERRFAKDARYASGWRDGYDICRRSKAQ
jgi:hypothetical protein